MKGMKYLNIFQHSLYSKYHSFYLRINPPIKGISRLVERVGLDRLDTVAPPIGDLRLPVGGLSTGRGCDCEGLSELTAVIGTGAVLLLSLFFCVVPLPGYRKNFSLYLVGNLGPMSNDSS